MQATEPTTLNGRPYEAVVRVTPPGPMRPPINLLQRDLKRTFPLPPDVEEDKPFDPYGFDESDSDEDGVPDALPDDRELTDDFLVPQFWGVVQVNDCQGWAGSVGYERDNSMRWMLSGVVYYSAMTNDVYAGQSALDAMEYERTHDTSFREVRPRSQVYERTRRGLPLNPMEVKKLRTLVMDGRRFAMRERIEAFLLLRELHDIARRVGPESHDRAMRFLLEPGKYSGMEGVLPPGAFRDVRLLERATPPRHAQPPPLSDVMRLDELALYVLRYHRPGSMNPISGIA